MTTDKSEFFAQAVGDDVLKVYSKLQWPVAKNEVTLTIETSL